MFINVFTGLILALALIFIFLFFQNRISSVTGFLLTILLGYLVINDYKIVESNLYFSNILANGISLIIVILLGFQLFKRFKKY